LLSGLSLKAVVIDEGRVSIRCSSNADHSKSKRAKYFRSQPDPIAFGWLNPAVQAVKRGDSFIGTGSIALAQF
jgi:hypothetical protein